MLILRAAYCYKKYTIKVLGRVRHGFPVGITGYQQRYRSESIGRIDTDDGVEPIIVGERGLAHSTAYDGEKSYPPSGG